MTKTVVDLMTGRDDRYIVTVRIEPALNMITGYYGDRPVVSVGATEIFKNDAIDTKAFLENQFNINL